MTPRRRLLRTLPWLALAARAQTRLPRVGVIAPWQALAPRIPTSASADRVAALTLQRRWPVITVFPHLARSSALMAYGPDIRDMWRRAALQLGRILKGEPVATMPIERLDRFRFVINARTAAALGLTLPPALRVLADEVVQ